MNRVREVGRFRARSDDHTYETVIVEKQEMIEAANFDDPHAVVEGMITATTVKGRHCNWKAEGVYGVLESNGQEIIVRRIGK